MKSRLVCFVVLAATASVALSSCMATPTSAPGPKATKIDPGSLIGQVVSPVGTTWSGTDSAGDLTVFTLKADRSVTVTYGTNTFNEAGDTWAVKAGVLDLHVFIDATNGDLDYTGQYDSAAKTIAATGTTSVSAKTVTVTLAEK